MARKRKKWFWILNGRTGVWHLKIKNIDDKTFLAKCGQKLAFKHSEDIKMVATVGFDGKKCTRCSGRRVKR